MPIDTGDRGQRYEVRYTLRETGEEKVFGWTNNASGGFLVKSIEANPSMKNPQVIDRTKTPDAKKVDMSQIMASEDRKRIV